MIGWIVAATALGLALWYWRERSSCGTARIVAEKARNGDFCRALYAA